MTKANNYLDSNEDSFYSEHTYTDADIYGDASLLGRLDIDYHSVSRPLEDIQRVNIFSTPTDNFKNL
jgi:hypothetical protein